MPFSSEFRNFCESKHQRNNLEHGLY
jgi:hypothetical protein